MLERPPAINVLWWPRQYVGTATDLPRTALTTDVPTFPDGAERNTLTADCRRCPELAESRTCISWGNGPLDADLVVVGEAPAEGDSEAEHWQGGNLTGMAYTSRRSGRKVRDLLADAGFSHDDCYYTNAVKCHPPGNRDPTDAELANCRPYLVEEVEAIEPTAVVATGKHATKTVLALDGESLDGFLDSVLDPRRSEALGVPVVPLLHPSYQEVWLSRLGYDRETYVDALTDAVAGVADT
nr:uracil-DNA glycosylase [Haloarcula sp. R1-2]